jgi:hypothetical protein
LLRSVCPSRWQHRAVPHTHRVQHSRGTQAFGLCSTTQHTLVSFSSSTAPRSLIMCRSVTALDAALLTITTKHRALSLALTARAPTAAAASTAHAMWVHSPAESECSAVPACPAPVLFLLILTPPCCRRCGHSHAQVPVESRQRLSAARVARQRVRGGVSRASILTPCRGAGLASMDWVLPEVLILSTAPQ